MLSVLLPVYNNWPLTAQCLRSLEETTRGEDYEVIVIDNASQDETSLACQALGNTLFPGRFLVERKEQNSNFSGAINRAAALARGTFLFWLNNDTILSQKWLPPLVRAFTDEPNLGAIGPLLCYPPREGRSVVQHAGITFSFTHAVSHLYEGFPAEHRHIAKRRKLQAITGAAFYVPRERFLRLGGLDERFVNGFEDIEFCDRLCREGFVQSVIPESRIVHIGQQSAGRHDADAKNSALASALCTSLHSDTATLLREDGYQILLSPWLAAKRLIIRPTCTKKSHPFLFSRDWQAAPIEALAEAVLGEPYWILGALVLAKRWEALGQMKNAFATYQSLVTFCATPEVLLPFALFLKRNDPAQVAHLLPALRTFVISAEDRVSALYAQQKLLKAEGEDLLARQLQLMSAHNATFMATDYRAFVDCVTVLERTVHALRG